MGYWFEHFFIAVRNVLLTWFYLTLLALALSSYQLVKVVSGGRAPWKKFKFGITTTFSNWTISLFWGRAPRKNSIFVLRWFIKFILYFIILSTGQMLVAAFCLLAACLLLAAPLLPPAAAAVVAVVAAVASCCCCLLLLLLLLPSCCCRWYKHFAAKKNYSLGRLIWRWREIRAGDTR